MNRPRKAFKRLFGNRVSALPLYLTLLGSVWASAALSLLIANSSRRTLGMYFAGGVFAILMGCVMEFNSRNDDDR